MSKFLTIICLFFNLCAANTVTQELMEHGMHIYKFKQCLCDYTGNSVIAKAEEINFNALKNYEYINNLIELITGRKITQSLATIETAQPEKIVKMVSLIDRLITINNLNHGEISQLSQSSKMLLEIAFNTSLSASNWHDTWIAAIKTLDNLMLKLLRVN